MRTHDDELHIDQGVARQLIIEQFPQWCDQDVQRVATDGTVNAIFRIGSELVARFPLRTADPGSTSTELAREAEAMRELNVCSPFPSPKPIAVGAPGAGYPLPWSVQTWVPGVVTTPEGLAHSEQFAHDLTTLIRSLRAVDTRGRSFTGSGRGGNLQDSDKWMEVCFQKSEGLLPISRLRDLWATFRVLPPTNSIAMTHGDLIPNNLLVDGERLVGVLDGGGFGPADPALDLVAAWHMLDDDRREALRENLAIGELEWCRGAAWAFQQAMGLVWYYRETLPGMSALGQTTLSRISGTFRFNT